jgi:hypothetical protein
VPELDSEPIAQAILDARWRGVDVDLFLEQDYLRSDLKGSPPDLPEPKPGETPKQALFRTQWLEDRTELAENRRILAALLRSDVQVRGDYNPVIFHQKFVLRDYREGRRSELGAPLWLVQLHADGHAPQPEPRLHLRNAYVCRQYEVEVEQLRRGSFGRGMHGDVPKTYDLAGVPVKALFAPDHTPELEVMKQMLKVKENGEIWFAIFTFAGSSGIDDAMLAARPSCSAERASRCCSSPLTAGIS